MKITLRKGPNVFGVKYGADVDANELPPAEAEILQRLVDQVLDAASAGPAAPESTSAAPAGIAPDQREVTLRIEAQGRQLELTLNEGQLPQGVDALVEYLSRYEKVIPSQ